MDNNDVVSAMWLIIFLIAVFACLCQAALP